MLQLFELREGRRDMLVFANELFDAANKAKVGSDQGYRVRTVVGKSAAADVSAGAWEPSR